MTQTANKPSPSALGRRASGSDFDRGSTAENGTGAIPERGRSQRRTIGFVLYEGVEILDVSGPGEVFAQANRALGYDAYDLRYYADGADGQVMSTSGLRLAAQPLPRRAPRLDMLLVPGADVDALEQVIENDALLDWIDRTAARCERLVSICTGAFLLGALGHLDGRRATSHWAALEELARRHPAARIEDDALWVRDGDIWTSAGVLSGVDLALAMVREDHGSAVALAIARRLVVYLMRDGAQSQFSAPVDLQARASRSDLSNLVAWLQGRLEAPTSVEAMAEHMLTSPRSLHRRCREVLELTPAQLLAELRLEQARVLLQQGCDHLEGIAARCGYASQSALTRAFKARFGVAPSRFRERFRDAR